MADPTDNSLYGYYRAKTDALGDYNAFQFRLRDHMRSEFLGDADALAAYFSGKLGLGKGDVYTVFMPTIAEAIIVFFALNRLGVIVNFVHPQMPAAAIPELIAETKSKGIVVLDRAVGDYAAAIGRLGLPVLLCAGRTYVEADKSSVRPVPEARTAFGDAAVTEYGEALAAGRELPAAESVATGRDLAIFLQGGGTTGKSRTIMLTNANINAFLEMSIDGRGLTAHPGIDTALNCMPLFHVFGLFSTAFLPMCCGCKTIFLPQFDAGEFIELMRLNHVTILRGVPNMFAKLLAHPEWDGPHLRYLQHIIVGGDSLDPVLHGRIDYTLAKNGADIRIAQGYGLTECCGGVMLNPPGGKDDETIGRAFKGMTIEIWGEDHKPLPDGRIGEIAVSGPTVMYGYLSDDRKPDVGVYRDESGRRWMLTGDLGYKKGEYFYFSGRRKRLVIISGHNAYPLDIEKIVNKLPYVRESCAVQGFDDRGKIMIRLFVALREGVDTPEAELTESILAACAEKLQKLSLPREVRYIPEIPKTRVGKADFMRLTQLHPGDEIIGL